ncbi:tetratricopeptide (TPR) repeat protein [Sporohalobacter salinus]|nr:tetratricopeptide (TPR) repeat protein [Sporohalobacter salinus]
MRYDEIVDSYVIDVKEKKKRSQVTSIIFGVITVIVSFVLLIGLYIGSYVGLFKYAQYVHHNGNTQQAIKIFSGMLGKYPHMKGFILFGRGDYYRILGKHKLAIRDLKKSLEIRKKEGYSKMGDTLEIYLYLYELYKKIDKEKIAKKYATEGINYGEKWIPEITDSDIKDGIYNNVAILYRKKQAFKKAIEYYTKAINLNNNYYGAYFNRSLVYRDIGKIDKALEDLNKCIMIDEKHNMAYYYKAYTFYEQNKYKEALKVIKKYRKVVGEVKDENIKKLEKIIKEEKANESKEK